MAKKSKIILFVVNAPEFFFSHRLPIAVAAQQAGFEVHVATANGPEIKQIQAYGIVHHVVPFSRSGQNPLNELKTILALMGLFTRLKPELVHLITIKPVLYGGIAARVTGIKAVVSAISGLGTVFLTESIAARARRRFITFLYRYAFNHERLSVIFQNSDDRDALLSLGVLRADQVRIIRGSGVPLAEYPYLTEPEGKPIAVMAARLLKDKGVHEFREAARLLHQRSVNVEMRLIGSLDLGNLTSVTQRELDQWASEGHLKLLGYRRDIAEQYAAANVVCLPSYREGLPKSLIEAAACGRAVVTTDVPGCRDAIVPGETGLLVPVKNAVELANAIQYLLENSEQRRRMGRAGRALAEDAFAIEKIVDQHICIYRYLLK